jgi:hypothetical protein
MRKIIAIVTGWLLMLTIVQAQNYHAVNGSSYAGVLGAGNNPASIVNTPFAWDVDVFSFQVKPATNAVTVHKYSLLSTGANSEYQFDAGKYKRFVNANFNVNLFNTRIALNRRAAIAGGINIRSYTNVKTSPYYFIDTIQTARDFFVLNDGNTQHSLSMTTSSWAEIWGTYAQTLLDNERMRLNAGVTLRVSRGLSGGHAGLSSGRVERVMQGSTVNYILRDVTARYGYSANYDPWINDAPTGKNLKNFVTNTEGGASIDVGVEYLIKEKGFQFFNDDEDRYFDYDWKIGISLMDVGMNQYRYGSNSRVASGFKDNITSLDLDKKFNGVEGFKDFNDSLETIVSSMSTLSGKFSVLTPARLIVNVDRYLFDAFYVNADLSINLSSLSDKCFYVKEMNLLTVTPRWETRRWGFYMPILYNTENQLRIGGAVKAGPLLIGIHNWGTIFAQNKMQNGGGYLAFIIRPKRDTGEKRSKKYDCPTF